MSVFVGTILKKSRKKAGLSVEDVYKYLLENNIHSNPKTIYGWENNFSFPNIHTFLLLCKCYGIKDILSTFGYDSFEQNKYLCFYENEYSKEELEEIQKYAEFIKAKRK